MKPSGTRCRAAAALTCLILSADAAGQIGITMPTNPTDPEEDVVLRYAAVDPCGKACICFTLAYPITHQNTPAAGSAFDTVLGIYFPGWNVTYGGQLNGTFDVERYVAHVCEPVGIVHGAPVRVKGVHCIHGLELWMVYQPGPGEAPPANREEWIIQYKQNGGHGCSFGPPEPNRRIDHGGGQWSPFFNRKPFAYWDEPQQGCASSQYNSKCPGAKCPMPCEWWTRLDTYMAYGTEGGRATGDLTVFDGISWGFKAVCLAGASPCAGPRALNVPGGPVHYEPASRVLHFGDRTLDVLNRDGSKAMDPAFAGDPVLGATVSITDFTFYQAVEGLYLFEGGTVTIHKDGVVFMEAAVPYLILDDQAGDEFGDNLYAQLKDPQFNLASGSAWLAEYAQTCDDPYAFAALRGLTAGPLEPSIDAEVLYVGEAVLGPGFCVPAPPALWWILPGGLWLLGRRSRTGRR